MKNIPSYRLFLTSIVYLLLVSQIWANAGPYSDWMDETQLEPIELNSTENINFAEEDIGKELDEKFKMRLFVPVFGTLKLPTKFSLYDSFLSMHAPEVTTPPPEPIFPLS